MSEGRLEHDTDMWISKVTTVLKTNIASKKKALHLLWIPHSCVCACESAMKPLRKHSFILSILTFFQSS